MQNLKAQMDSNSSAVKLQVTNQEKNVIEKVNLALEKVN